MALLPIQLKTTKVCSQCKCAKPISEFYTVRVVGKDPVFRVMCKLCSNKTSQNYYQRNKKKMNRITQQWYNEHKEIHVELRRRYRETHKEQMNEQMKEYRKTHKKECTAYNKDYVKEHYDYIKQQQAQIRKVMPDSYIRQQIFYQLGIERDQIPESMILLKRAQLQMIRTIKQINSVS